MTQEPRKPTVLFVDDELDVLLGLQVSLRKSPVTALVTTQPSEVPFLLRSHPIDVVVCDERMPSISGSALLDAISKRFPETARILLTGHCDLPMAIRAIKQGRLFRYLTKPVSSPALTAAILQAVSEHSLTNVPAHVRRARTRFRLLRDLESAYPGMTQEIQVDAAIRVNPAEALLGALDDPTPFGA
jgi:two-component system, probable response regulator PhcQ